MVGTLYVGSDRYALQVVENVNNNTAVAVHIDDEGRCVLHDGIPCLEILRKKKDGRWFRNKSEFIEGEAINYQDSSF